MKFKIIILIYVLSAALSTLAQSEDKTKFKVISFYTAKQDQAHISFVHEAHKWFTKTARENNFTYDSTNDWSNLNAEFLSHFQVVLFLDTRPEAPEQRQAFEDYMKDGGAWMGFHFAGFALTPSDYPQNWDWYHNEFIGAGQYQCNTWRPTPAVLRVEDRKHPSTRNQPLTFRSATSEWYCWEYDLRKKPDIKILLSIDSTSFPLGTKADETWHNGYYPVAWTNKNYNMLYVNMGHNDIDYDGGTNKTLSSTFASEEQNRFFIEALLWLGSIKKKK